MRTLAVALVAISSLPHHINDNLVTIDDTGDITEHITDNNYNGVTFDDKAG